MPNRRTNSHVIYELTDEDRKKIRKVRLESGAADAQSYLTRHELCIMQLVSLLTVEADKIPTSPDPGTFFSPRAFTDDPVCVSEVIRGYLVELNDAVPTVAMRNKLKRVAEEVINTCPVVMRLRAGKKGVVETQDWSDPAYSRAESERASILDAVPIYNEEGGYNRRISMDRRIEAIRKAAAVYKVTEVSGATHG